MIGHFGFHRLVHGAHHPRQPTRTRILAATRAAGRQTARRPATGRIRFREATP